MTVTNESYYNEYTGSGTGPYTVSFKVVTYTDLKIIKKLIASPYTETTLSYPTDWTISIGSDASQTSAVTLTSSLSSSYKLKIFINTPLKQNSSFRSQADRDAATDENTHDTCRNVDKHLKRMLDGALRLPDSENPASYDMQLGSESERAGKLLAFDSVGDVDFVEQVDATTITTGSFVAYVDTISTLKGLSAPSSAVTYFVRGYYSAGDGGGGHFKWSSSDSSTDNGGTIIQRTAGGTGRWNRICDGDISVKWFGAKADNSNDDTTYIQAAIDAIKESGGGVFFPRGQYKITSTITISSGQKVKLYGAGSNASRLMNNITGAASEPCLKITSTGNYFTAEALAIEGNGLTGASGNGNAISLINLTGGATFQPQIVNIKNCLIASHRGTGKDQAGSSIAASGIYAYLGTGLFIDNTVISSCGIGLYGASYQKLSASKAWIDACDNNCVYLDTCDQGHFSGCTLNGTGSGGTTDGLIYLKTSQAICFTGCRIKNGNPYCVNMAGTNNYNYSISFIGCDFNQLDSASGHTAIRMTNGTNGCVITGNRFTWVNSITDAVGIYVEQNAGGFECGGLVISGNFFNIGNGGTITSCVLLNVTSNKVVAPIIEGNSIMPWTAGGTTAVTSAIDLEGIVVGASIRNNTFAAPTGITITNCIKLGTSTITETVIQGNVYRANGGTITNNINNSGNAPSVTTIEGGALKINAVSANSGGQITSFLSAASNMNFAAPGGVPGETDLTIAVTGAALGDTVSLGLGATVPVNYTVTPFVSAANTVTVRLHQYAGAAAGQNLGNCRVDVWKH